MFKLFGKMRREANFSNTITEILKKKSMREKREDVMEGEREN